VPQLAQLIDCIVNVVCHMSAAESRSEYVAADRGVVGVLWRGREGSPESTIDSPPVRKRREERAKRRRFRRELGPEPIGDSPLHRNNKTATRRECTISMSANKKFPE